MIRFIWPHKFDLKASRFSLSQFLSQSLRLKFFNIYILFLPRAT